MNKKLKYILVYLVILSCTVDKAMASGEITELIARTKEAGKVEHLYTVRYNLNLLREKGGLSLQDKRELLTAYSLLTESFKQWNHFRNADIVYLDYLEILDDYHKEYSKFLADSVQDSNMKELAMLQKNSEELDKEISVLEAKKEVISGMKTRYYVFSLIATIAILAGFLFMLIKKNKSIAAARKATSVQRQKIESLFKNQIEAAIAEGSVSYAKYASAECVGYIESIEEYFNMEKDQKINEKSLVALEKYKQLLKNDLPR